MLDTITKTVSDKYKRSYNMFLQKIKIFVIFENCWYKTNEVIAMLLKKERCLEKIRPFYDLDIIKVLVGSRRADKSKVLELIINELKERGVDEQDILYINFENLDFEEISDYKKLNTYVKEHKGTNKHYLFFDEIQHVSWFEKAINSFRVSFDCSIFIAGSNSKMLSSEISTLLSGKIIEHCC